WVEAEGANGTHAADAQHNLLRDAHLVVAAIESCGEGAVSSGVGDHVGIHKVERDTPDLDAPDLGKDLAARQLHADHHLVARRIGSGRGGHLSKVELVVDRLLLAVALEALAEIALRIKEADADEGQSQVAGLLAVVAGENAEAAGIDGERLVE